MKRTYRFYTLGITGAIGGLLGWQLSNLLGLSFTESFLLSEAIAGALIGGLIGLGIGIGQGLLEQSWGAALKKGGITFLLGALGGAIALPLAETLFLAVGGESWSRPLGWAIFGLLVGFATSITGGSQLWKGGLGGLVGGLVGGILLEISRALLADLALGKAAGLILLGFSTGVFTAMISFVLSRTWLEIVSGKITGMEFILDKFLRKDGPSATIGSSPLKAEIAIPDEGIDPQHAILEGHDTYFTLKDISIKGTYLEGKKIDTAKLKNMQHIRIGKTEMIYHEKR
ncbi:MAG: FHA domain-containing protein [Chloroflexi bacterium]|nr:FHA domain-containing protein [Chloroflexota bacterium]